MQIGSPQAMMLAFETRCRQFQLGVQGYCSPQKEDQRPPLLNLKTRRRQPKLEDVIATKPSCQMQFKLFAIKKDVKPQPCKEVYQALKKVESAKAESGKAQFKIMIIFLDKLKEQLKIWEESLCQKCRPIFLQYEPWIKTMRQQMDNLMEGLVATGLRAASFNSTIEVLKLVIKMFSYQNQCITIPTRTKTQQGAYRREESFNEENWEQTRPHTNEQQFKIEE